MERSPLTPGGRRNMDARDPAATGPSRRAVLGLGSVVLAAVTGCTPRTAPPAGTATAGTSSSTRPPALDFRFGTAAVPGPLDPALAVDAETFRVTRQIFEGLVNVDPDTGAPQPGLATSWTVSDDGLTYTFTLRRGVLFQDGTKFTADAVVTNFRRWAGFPASIGGRPGQAFESVFHHHERQPEDVADGTAGSAADDGEGGDSGGSTDSGSGPEPDSGVGSGSNSNSSSDARDPRKPAAPAAKTVSATYYAGCRAQDAHTFILRLRKPITGLIEALTLPGFGIASPTALKKHAADDITEKVPGQLSSGFGKNPVGTGPFTFTKNDGETLTVTRYARHWLDQGQISTATFRVLRDPASRLRALSRKEIDGYDMVTLDGLRALVRQGQQILQRDPFSVFYLGMNRTNSFLAEDAVRRAAAHAINRQDLIQKFFIAGTKEARSFVPPSLGVPDAETYYGFDQGKARDLLASSGYDGEPIPFSYPLNVTRAYLPLPERIYAAMSAQLTAVGFEIQPVPIDWEDGYLQAVLSARRPGFHLLGLSGSYRDPDNFIGTLFGAASTEFGYDSASLRAKIVAARSMPNGDPRAAAYQEIGEQLARDLPALPIAYPISAVAASEKVIRYPTSPTMDEVFDRVTLAT